VLEAHSISAGLDYPGVGPEHSWLRDSGRVGLFLGDRRRALDAFQLTCRLEESFQRSNLRTPSHAVRIAPTLAKDKIVVIGLSGRGDKDVFTVAAASGRSCDVGHAHRRALRQIARRQARGFIPFITAGDPDNETS